MSLGGEVRRQNRLGKGGREHPLLLLSLEGGALGRHMTKDCCMWRAEWAYGQVGQSQT